VQLVLVINVYLSDKKVFVVLVKLSWIAIQLDCVPDDTNGA
jgi:hypothetical protein